MPAKKKSKVIKKIVIPRKVYEFLTGEEVKAIEQKHANHIKNIKDSLNYITESCSTVAQLDEQLFNFNKWQEYVNCFPLPKAYIPPDIRLLIEKLKYFENISNKENIISWRLLINDRSILTQNFNREDLTHSTLKLGAKTDLGSVYDKDVDICLKMLQRIDDFLENVVEVGKCDVLKLNDIKELRNYLQQQIVEFLNRFTYNVLCSEESNMNSIDALTSEYNFQSNNFQMHIWTLKNVPIRFQQLANLRFIAKLYGVNVTLSIPTIIIQENFTIRALHLNFDHISEKADINEVTPPPDSGSFAITNLTECLNNEWLMQLEIMNSVRNELMQIRQEYEEKVKFFKEQEAKKKSKRNEEELTKISRRQAEKLMGLATEPDLIDNDTFPNIIDDFLEKEQGQYDRYFNTIYSPTSLNLATDEINLKKYFILGGVYQLYKVQKPQHIDFNSFNMTWHLNNSKLLTTEDLVIPLDTKSNQRRSTVYRRETRKTLTFTKSDLELNDANESDCPWFILTIQLPKYLCYWGQPVVCQYKTVAKVKGSPVLLENNKKLSTFETSLLPPKYLPFFGPQKEGLTNSILELEHPSRDSFFRTSISNIHLAQEKFPLRERARDLEGVLNIRDFPLTSFLSKPQIRQIQKHVIPRMISSFKFNKEIQEDKLGEIQKKGKSKTKAGNIIRQRAADAKSDQISENKHLFIFGPMQNNPERLIPIYARDEPIRLLELKTDIKETTAVNQPVRSFAQLVKLINFIKWWHKVQVRKFIDNEHFKSRYPVVNKHLQGFGKQKFKLLFSTSSIRSVAPSKTRTKLQANISFPNISLSSKITPTEVSEHEISSTIIKDSISMKDSISLKDSMSLKDSISKTRSYDSDINKVVENNVEQDLQTFSSSHWTTQHILKTEFNREMHAVIVQTNRLAFKQYEHFPFKSWKLEPNKNDPANEVIFTLQTQHVICILYINENGIRCRVTDDTTKYTSKPKMYLIVDEPISDLKDLKKILKEKNLNIFADIDARFYIENGYFSEKHLSTELHTYDCMAANSTQVKFIFSHWNRLAQRRDIVLKFLQYEDSEINTVEVRITPEEAFFVEIEEMCSDDLNEIKLNFHLTWRNISVLSDLNHLINSVYPTVNEMKCKNAKLLNFVRNLLYDIRPLSFS